MIVGIPANNFGSQEPEGTRKSGDQDLLLVEKYNVFR